MEKRRRQSRCIKLIYRNHSLSDGSSPNRSINAATGGLGTMLFAGNVLAIPFIDKDGGYHDFIMKDYRNIVDALATMRGLLSSGSIYPKVDLLERHGKHFSRSHFEISRDGKLVTTAGLSGQVSSGPVFVEGLKLRCRADMAVWGGATRSRSSTMEP